MDRDRDSKSDMNKIAVLYSGGRQWGGIETYLSNLFRMYDHQRMHLLLFSLGRWELTEELVRQGLAQDLRTLSGRRLSVKTLLELKRLVRSEQVDLVVSQGVVANAYARLAAKTTGVPNLTVVHSHLDLDYPSFSRRWLYKLSDRLLRSGTSRYIAVSGYLKEKAVQSGVDAGVIHVVYNGVNEHGSQFEAPTENKKIITLVSVGRLHPVKNFDSLVKAMKLLPDETRLTIWGEGMERPRLEGLIQELELAGRVILPGESVTMTQALKGGDIYIQPSKSEGCSFAVAEAMLHGKPVVVAPYGGLPEQVSDRVTGLVTRDATPEGLAESIEALLDDPPLAGKLGMAAKESAEEMYSIDKWLNETTTVFCGTAGPVAHTE